MDVFDVVMKLNGPVAPVGDSGIDAVRLQNLESLCGLTEALLDEIEEVASTGGDHMVSIKQAKQRASAFIAAAVKHLSSADGVKVVVPYFHGPDNGPGDRGFGQRELSADEASALGVMASDGGQAK